MFRRVLLCGGVSGRLECLDSLRRIIGERKPDALLFVGGVLPADRPSSNGHSPWRLNREDGRFVEAFFATLGKLDVFSAVIPAACDEPLEEFLRLGMRAELRFPNVHIAHAALVEEGGMAVCGLGGVVAEEDLLGLDTCSRTMAEYFLRALWKTNQPRKALLLPAPPSGRLGGLEGEGLVSDLIDSFHPDLCVVAGGSEHRGRDDVGNTLIVNPGRLVDGGAAMLSWNGGREKQVEFFATFAGLPGKEALRQLVSAPLLE